MRQLLFLLITSFLSSFLSAQTDTSQIVDPSEVSRILNTLAADDMKGRASFSPDIERAADFIANEFNQIGLQPYAADHFRQAFEVTRISPLQVSVEFDGRQIPPERIIVSGSQPQVTWTTGSPLNLLHIQAGEDLPQRIQEASVLQTDVLIIVDTSFAQLFERYRGFMMQGRIDQAGQPANNSSMALVLAGSLPDSYNVTFSNKVEKLPLFNVVAMLPGKSKPEEYVIFSAHYDHIGMLDAVGQDSIANGADDDASGVTSVISLARYFKKRDDNARTLLFVAFTAEELGLIGSKYFSSQINADQVVAMVNMEMIGKDSKFGPNALYVTGYDRSNLASIMQQNVAGTGFAFHPDPYPRQNLFYRSDNASLAALGVPAHSFSTVQIENDNYYHTVKDEVGTLNLDNIVSSIKAIALGVQGIVTGKDTPSRVPKLND